MEVWNNPANYKRCQKKQYDIWACMPPPGTIVVNKLEQPNSVKALGGKTYFTEMQLVELSKRNPAAVQQLQAMIQRGEIYCTKPGDMVLSGTRGELWVTKQEKVMQTYQVSSNGSWVRDWSSVFNQRAIKRGETVLIPWIKVHADGAQNGENMACFVPKKERGQIRTSWAVLNINAQGVEHGLGDFVVCQAQMVGGKLQPNMNDRWVVNGAVFADTYNNQGWANCVQPQSDMFSAPEPAPLFEYSKQADEKQISQDLYNFVGRLVQQCTQEQHRELSFRGTKGQGVGEILLQARTVVDFAKKNSTDEFKTVGVATKITVNPNNTVTFVTRLQNENNGVSKDAIFTIHTPKGCTPDSETIDPKVTAQFLQDNRELVFGLCGFVREVGIKGAFKYSQPFTKQDYDGIRDYTMTSGATNRLCRGMSGKDEHSGEGKAQAIRTITNCDAMFNKVVTCRPLRVFRGEPYDSRVAGLLPNFEAIEGFRSVNTAYSSTTLNVQSAPMFAHSSTPQGQGNVKGGIIWAIELRPDIRAHYVHNAAGWKQQFEVLLDRCYDLVAGTPILEFTDNTGCRYKVVPGTVVPHAAGGPLDQAQSGLLYKVGKTHYNLDGKVDFEKEYSDGVLHEAFNKIRERGYSDIQWQAAYDSKNDIIASKVNTRTTFDWTGKDIDIDAAIVLRVNNPDAKAGDLHQDVAITLEDSGMALRTHIVRANINARQNHGDAEDLRWSQYGLGFMGTKKTFVDGKLKSLDSVEEINNFDMATWKNTGNDDRRILRLQTGTSDEIAQVIINYAKTHKNICLLPLIDVARYFDQVFAQVINNEGYELMRTIRVERHYDKNSERERNDPQAGFVPCKYQITGDNDDHLVIDVKFERDKASGKLQISYRGQSQGMRVNESKTVQTDIFDNGRMLVFAERVLYVFAKKMHLSKARKFDRLLGYFCSQTRSRVVMHNPKEENIHKSYRVWTNGGKNYFNVDIIKKDIELFQVVIEFDDGKVSFLDMDFSESIFSLYHKLCWAIMDGGNSGNLQS